jgi:hypothetical protein
MTSIGALVRQGLDVTIREAIQYAMPAALWSWTRIRAIWVAAILITAVVARFVYTIPERNAADFGAAWLDRRGTVDDAFSRMDFRWSVQRPISNLLVFAFIPVPLLWATGTWLRGDGTRARMLPFFARSRSRLIVSWFVMLLPMLVWIGSAFEMGHVSLAFAAPCSLPSAYSASAAYRRARSGGQAKPGMRSSRSFEQESWKKSRRDAALRSFIAVREELP